MTCKYTEPLKNEKKFQRMAQLGKELGVPVTECFLEMEVKTSNGKTIHHHRQRSHSWTRWAYVMLFCNIAGKDAGGTTYGAGYLGIRDTGGTGKGGEAPFAYTRALSTTGNLSILSAETTDWGLRAGGGDASKGIVVGTGDAAESFDSYRLVTPIANGVGAGQMSYVLSEKMSEAYDAVTRTKSNSLVRYINNNSGGLITVKEVGLIGKMTGASSQQPVALVSRDLLSPFVDVPDAGQLKVTYVISLVYPE